MTDFDKIVLSDNDLQYLESARYGAVLRLHPVVAGHLVNSVFWCRMRFQSQMTNSWLQKMECFMQTTLTRRKMQNAF